MEILICHLPGFVVNCLVPVMLDSSHISANGDITIVWQFIESCWRARNLWSHVSQ